MPRSRAGAPPTVALAAVETLARPDDMDGDVELAFARPASRTFPPRASDTLGVCLKAGPSHRVRADGRWLDYPADSVCIRPPGCVWSSAETGPVGFVSVDVAASWLPERLWGRPMVFARAADFGDLRRVALLLLSRAPRLEKDEAVSRLVSLAARCYSVGSPGLGDGGAPPAALERARAFLRASLGANPSLDGVARAAGVNKHVLVRRFRGRFGVTPHAYLLIAKVDRAREMLARGAPAVEVAAALGFADQAHLTRTFRGMVGLTPAAYQRRVRAIA